MRLAQLARKLAIRPTEIVEFLTEQNIQIEEGSNTRLEDEHVGLIMQKFAPARAAEVAAELVIEKEREHEALSEKETIEPTVPAAIQLTESVSIVSEELLEKPEVIKAPKVELSGLKVLGKIELPAPKKKEPQLPTDEAPADPVQVDASSEPLVTPKATEKRRQENRKPYPNKRESTDRPKINPIALQREREALEAEKKRRAQAKEEKEKRTQHYLKKVKTPPPTKSAKLVDEEVEEMKALPPAPKSLWGKFMKWLNT